MACERYAFCKVEEGNPVGMSFYLCDTEGEKPTVNRVGDICVAKDSGKLYKCTAVNTWTDQGSGSSGAIALTQIAPSTNQSIPAGYSAQSVRSYLIASGTKLTVASGARFKID